MTNLSHTYPPRLLRYVTVMIAVTVPVAVGAVLQIASDPPGAGTVAGVVLFFLAATAAEYKPVPLDENGGRTVSLAFIFLVLVVSIVASLQADKRDRSRGIPTPQH